MTEGEWYWCRRHDRIERRGDCPGTDQLGPYPTQEAARRHDERTEARNDAWEQQDRAWEEQGASDSWSRWD